MTGRRLGLGCSRFGSLVNGIDLSAALSVVHAALDLGIVDFDTANIYGQGDSERMLGKLLGSRRDVRIHTKAGQRFPLKKRLMIPLKPILRPIVARRAALRESVAGSRAETLPQDWGAAHLRMSLDRSLRRLRREQVDVFLLHSPPAEVLEQGDAMAELARLKNAGKAARIGASVDDLAALTAALADPSVEIVQFALSPAAPIDHTPLDEARARGVEFVSREILGGVRNGDGIDAALRFAAAQPVDLALLGTRSPARLAAAHHVIVETKA